MSTVGQRSRARVALAVLGAVVSATAGCSSGSEGRDGSPSSRGGDSAAESGSGSTTAATTVVDRCRRAFEAAELGGELSDDPTQYRETLEQCVDVATWRAAAVEFGAQILTPQNSGLDAANILDFSLCADAKSTPVCKDAARLLAQPTASSTPGTGNETEPTPA